MAERFANGQATQAEFEETRVTMERLSLTASNQNYNGASVKAAAATTEKIAGLAARDAAYSAAAAASHYAGMKASHLVPVSPNEIENYCESNAAYDLARHSAFDLTMKAQKEEFIRLLMSLKQG